MIVEYLSCFRLAHEKSFHPTLEYENWYDITYNDVLFYKVPTTHILLQKNYNILPSCHSWIYLLAQSRYHIGSFKEWAALHKRFVRTKKYMCALWEHNCALSAHIGPVLSFGCAGCPFKLYSDFVFFWKPIFNYFLVGCKYRQKISNCNYRGLSIFAVQIPSPKKSQHDDWIWFSRNPHLVF